MFTTILTNAIAHRKKCLQQLERQQLRLQYVCKNFNKHTCSHSQKFLQQLERKHLGLHYVYNNFNNHSCSQKKVLTAVGTEPIETTMFTRILTHALFAQKCLQQLERKQLRLHYVDNNFNKRSCSQNKMLTAVGTKTIQTTICSQQF